MNYANREEAMRAGMAAGEALARRHNRRDALRMIAVAVILLALASALVLSRPSKADLPVIDPSHIFATEMGFAKDLAAMGEQLAVAKQAYQAAVGQLGAMLRSIDPNQLANQIGALNPLGDVTQLTGSVTGIQGMVSGRGLNMNGLVNRFMQGNNYYTSPYAPTGFQTGYAADRTLRSSTSLSSLQAMATQSLTSVQDHLSGIEELQAELSVATTEADLSALRGKIEAQTAALNGQALQLSALNSMWQAQKEAFEQRSLQKQRQDADRLLQSVEGNGQAPAAGGMVATGGNAPPVMPTTFTTMPPGG